MIRKRGQEAWRGRQMRGEAGRKEMGWRDENEGKQSGREMIKEKCGGEGKGGV